MFVLRDAHLEAFSDMAEEMFRLQVVEHLRLEHGALVYGLPDSLLHQMVKHGIARARRHELRSERALTAFVGLMFEIAPNFDEHPRIRELLSSAQVRPEYRLDWLLSHASTKHWEEASGEYRATAWFPEETDV